MAIASHIRINIKITLSLLKRQGLNAYIWKYFTSKIVFLGGTFIFADTQKKFSITKYSETQKLKSELCQK